MKANKPTLAIHLALVVVLSLFATTGATRAQQPSATAVDLARQIIVIKGGSNMFDPIIPGVIETAKNNFLPTNPGLSKDLNEVALLLRKEFEPKRAELLNEVSRAYAERFSELL